MAFIPAAFGSVYPVRSAAELNNLLLMPGDTVILQEGLWKNQELVFTGIGKSDRPIVLTTANPYKVVMGGNSSLKIDGTYLVVDGLHFKDGNDISGDIISFSDSASWCRLTNTAVIDYNPKNKGADSRYVSMRGHHNRVDHCFFQGKANHGPTLVVWLNTKPNFHQIDHNHFGHRPPLGENGGETIRIGTSTWSLHQSHTVVEYNLFDRCDGELEIISNKSCHNIIRYNTFFESKGTLTLRHGNDARVYGNYFIGNSVKGTGGIRIIGEDHVVINNYFRDLAGEGVSAAICMVDGIPNSPLVGYFQVKRAHVLKNTIINCAHAFAIGTGRDEKRYLPPEDCIIAGNVIYLGAALVQWSDQPERLQCFDNTVYGNESQSLQGFSYAAEKLFKDSYFYHRKNFQKPPLHNADVGPSWKK